MQKTAYELRMSDWSSDVCSSDLVCVQAARRRGVKALLSGISMLAMLSGCVMGVQPGGDSPSVSYKVPRNYQIVYLRAQNQASECLTGKNQYDVYAQVEDRKSVV